MLKFYLEKLFRYESLTSEEFEDACTLVLSGENTAQLCAFLTALKYKGETAEELYTLVKLLHKKMISVDLPYPCLDIVGTGGDGFNTVNISTASALLAASCGVKIAKHGNRSVSSLSGSADVLESLGVNIQCSPEKIAELVDAYNIGFFFAPHFHPVFSDIKQLRKELGFPTVFNLIGPFLNPAKANHLMLGVAKKAQLTLFRDVLLQLNIPRALVFHGCGLDEITCVGKTDIIEINHNTVTEYEFDPKDYGFNLCSLADIQGGTPDVNAKLIEKTLKGEEGPLADTFILNAGFAIYLYGLCETLEKGFSLARESLLQGKAYELLQGLVADSNAVAPPDVISASSVVIPAKAGTQENSNKTSIQGESL